MVTSASAPILRLFQSLGRRRRNHEKPHGKRPFRWDPSLASSRDAKLRLFDVISLMEGLMPRKCVCVALVAIFALAASRSGHAQVTVDVTKVNCDQFVHHKISEPRLIAAWLSGYYNAKRNNRVLDLQTFEENMSKVTNYCSDEKNFKVPVMKAVEQVLGK